MLRSKLKPAYQCDYFLALLKTIGTRPKASSIVDLSMAKLIAIAPEARLAKSLDTIASNNLMFQWFDDVPKMRWLRAAMAFGADDVIYRIWSNLLSNKVQQTAMLESADLNSLVTEIWRCRTNQRYCIDSSLSRVARLQHLDHQQQRAGPIGGYLPGNTRSAIATRCEYRSAGKPRAD